LKRFRVELHCLFSAERGKTEEEKPSRFSRRGAKEKIVGSRYHAVRISNRGDLAQPGDDPSMIFGLRDQYCSDISVDGLDEPGA
jgi:hypothetical protein